MTIDKYQFTVKQHTLGNIYIILIINHSTFNFPTHFPFFQLFFDGSKASNHCQLLIVIGQLFLLWKSTKKSNVFPSTSNRIIPIKNQYNRHSNPREHQVSDLGRSSDLLQSRRLPVGGINDSGRSIVRTL